MDVRCGRETVVVRGESFTSRFDMDKITQIGWFRFMEEIASNRYGFELYALFDRESVKRFECGSDLWVGVICGCLELRVMTQAFVF